MVETIAVQLVYAGIHGQTLQTVLLPANATLQQAIESSGILRTFPEIDLAQNRVGIYGKIKTLDTLLHDYDRIEIYRELLADPREKRRARVVQTLRQN